MKFRARYVHETADGESRKLEDRQKPDTADWQWRAQYEISFRDFVGGNDLDRRRWADELTDFGRRVLDKRDKASASTASSHWLARGAAGASAAVATLSGGALIGSLHGVAATVLGVATAALGVASGAIAAAKPEESYRVDLLRKAAYENLWWDVRLFACTQLVNADPDTFAKAMAAFAARERAILVLTGSETSG
jgi:hypothetical protein